MLIFDFVPNIIQIQEVIRNLMSVVEIYTFTPIYSDVGCSPQMFLRMVEKLLSAAFTEFFGAEKAYHDFAGVFATFGAKPSLSIELL